MREVQKYRYILAAVLTVTVFVMGVLFSNMMDAQRYQSLKNRIQQNSVEMESRQLQLSYLKSPEVNSCRALEAGLTDIVKGYNARLSDVQQYQKNSFFNRQQFRIVKREYVLSGIRYWMYAQRLRDKCNYSANTVLFFTRNLFGKSNCDKCTSLGSKLTLLKKKYEDELLIFTIPTSLDDGAVEMLERQYNITETPSLVINGRKKIEGKYTVNQVEKKLNITG